MVFPEFLEFIGRIAVLKFLNSELDDISLYEKICSVLDELLTIIGEKRKDGVIEIDFSASDENY